jgi:uncharacterized protein YecE (DUF72 family)
MPDLFGDDDPLPAAAPASGKRRTAAGPVEAAAAEASLHELAARLPGKLHMGTSSWSFPGWKDLVWAGEHTDAKLSRQGLPAYSRHPMLRAVSLDRSFYRPLSAVEYASYAAQVPEHFRFVVKAPSLVCDAVVRNEDGRGLQDNPAFLDPALAASEFVLPALEGLANKIGALVFQLSPLPAAWLARMPEVLDRLAALLAGLPDLKTIAPDAVAAIEVRNPEFLTPAFAALLRSAGATYCLGLHPKMPPIEQQLPMLRALWPAPLVCRWSLNARHGAFGYDEAKGLYEPFDRLVDPDPGTRKALARVIAGTLGAGFSVYVTINNKAEGSAPLSVIELAKAVEQEQLSSR